MITDLKKQIEQMKLQDLVPLLDYVSDRINTAIDNNEDTEIISDVVELMSDIANDNWLYIRNL